MKLIDYIRRRDKAIPADSATPSEPNRQDRIIVVLTAATGTVRFPAALASETASMVLEDSRWLIESLYPVPLLTTPVEQVHDGDLAALVDWTRTAGIRAVCHVGSVSLGNLGGKGRFTYGSSGDAISAAVEAAIWLPGDTQWWISSDASQALGAHGDLVPDAIATYNGIQFYALRGVRGIVR